MQKEMLHWVFIYIGIASGMILLFLIAFIIDRMGKIELFRGPFIYIFSIG